MRLYKLARLEILVVQKEAKEKRAEQKELKALLASDKARWGVVKEEIQEIAAQYKDERRTRIGGGREEVEYTEEAFIADEDAHVVITRDGWVKRVREMKDPASTRLREGDEVLAVLAGSLKSSLVLFSNFGTAYVTRFNDVPASTGYGDPVQKLFKFDDQERVVGALSLDARLENPAKLVAVSRQGYGLRFPLEPHMELSTRAGRRYAKPGEGDEIVGVQPAPDRGLLAVVTRSTHALVCKVNEVNELAGPGRGVTIIKTAEDDPVVAFLCTTDKAAAIELETEKGRKLELSPRKYEVSGRGGKGREMAKKDRIKVAQRPVQFVPLPEAKPEGKG
jgi:DNA gyrase subunit A